MVLSCYSNLYNQGTPNFEAWTPIIIQVESQGPPKGTVRLKPCQVKNKRSPALLGDDLWVGKVGGTKMEVQEFYTPIVIGSFIKMKHYSVFRAYERWESTAKMHW